MLPLLLLSLLLPLARPHGWLCKPLPRGYQHEKDAIDLLKSPNTKGTCRGEKDPGPVQKVSPGGSLTLEFNIPAPHTGPCEVYLLDLDLGNPKKLDEKYDCAAKGKVEPWTVTIPKDCSGRKVLRWYWEGRHISNPGEPYEQCVDLDCGGGDGGGKPSGDSGKSQGKSSKKPSEKSTGKPAGPPPVPDQDYGSGDGSSSGDDAGYGDDSGYSGDGDDDDDDGSGSGATGGKSGHNDSARKAGADSGGKGDCEPGHMRCKGDDPSCYQVCSNHAWVSMKCPTTTKCKPNGDYIACNV